MRDEDYQALERVYNEERERREGGQRSSGGFIDLIFKLFCLVMICTIIYMFFCFPVGFGQVLGTKIPRHFGTLNDALILLGICFISYASVWLVIVRDFKRIKEFKHHAFCIACMSLVACFYMDARTTIGFVSFCVIVDLIVGLIVLECSHSKDTAVTWALLFTAVLLLPAVIGVVYGAIEGVPGQDPKEMVSAYNLFFSNLWEGITTRVGLLWGKIVG